MTYRGDLGTGNLLKNYLSQGREKKCEEKYTRACGGVEGDLSEGSQVPTDEHIRKNLNYQFKKRKNRR